MSYILVTGASGFIGKRLLEYVTESRILDKTKILLLGAVPSPGFAFLHHKNYNFTKEDFLLKGYNEIELVIHMGAFIPKSSADINNYNSNFANVITTGRLLDNLPSRPRKFIFISTIDVYRNTNAAIDETTPAEPQSFYGTCKLFCEQMIIQWCNQNQVIPQILRLGHIYGAGEDAFKKLIPETIRKILRNENPVIYSSGLEKRSYLHVTDCVRAVINALSLDEYHGPINIASSKAYSVQDLVNTIIGVSGKKLQTQILNNDVPVRDIIFDNSKMEKYLGKEKIPIDTGLKEEFDAFSIKGE